MRVSLTASFPAFATLAFIASFASPQPQQRQKYPWQSGDTPCNETMTFCWYGAEDVSDPQVIAHGNRWTTQDKDEKGFEWITEVRCLKDLKLCILARNQKMMNGSQTNIDLYSIEEWSTVQIRTIGKGDGPKGKECEIDTLMLNRVEGSVSMLSTPGPAAATKPCMGIIKPKTVVYKLEIGLPGPKGSSSPTSAGVASLEIQSAMSQFLHKALHVVQVAWPYISSAAVLAFIGWLYRRGQENFENQVLAMFGSDPQRQLRTATGIHNDYRGRYLEDVPVWVYFPMHTNWRDGLKWRVRTVPYQVRHVWRMKFFMPSLKKVEKTVLRLWKQGLLIRDQAKPQYYKLKP